MPIPILSGCRRGQESVVDAHAMPPIHHPAERESHQGGKMKVWLVPIMMLLVSTVARADMFAYSWSLSGEMNCTRINDDAHTDEAIAQGFVVEFNKLFASRGGS